HHLELLGLLKIKTEEQFRARFERSPLRRPKRRGLIRNALVVLGNKKPDGAWRAIYDFATEENDVMLQEHAAWAIAQFDDKEAQSLARRLELHTGGQSAIDGDDRAVNVAGILGT